MTRLARESESVTTRSGMHGATPPPYTVHTRLGITPCKSTSRRRYGSRPKDGHNRRSRAPGKSRAQNVLDMSSTRKRIELCGVELQ